MAGEAALSEEGQRAGAVEGGGVLAAFFSPRWQRRIASGAVIRCVSRGGVESSQRLPHLLAQRGAPQRGVGFRAGDGAREGGPAVLARGGGGALEGAVLLLARDGALGRGPDGESFPPRARAARAGTALHRDDLHSRQRADRAGTRALLGADLGILDGDAFP